MYSSMTSLGVNNAGIRKVNTTPGDKQVLSSAGRQRTRCLSRGDATQDTEGNTIVHIRVSSFFPEMHSLASVPTLSAPQAAAQETTTQPTQGNHTPTPPKITPRGTPSSRQPQAPQGSGQAAQGKHT